MISNTLTNLNLYANRLGVSSAGLSDDGASLLFDAIKVNTTLTYLNLSGNMFADSGAGLLSDAFEVNTALTNLDLSSNGCDIKFSVHSRVFSTVS